MTWWRLAQWDGLARRRSGAQRRALLFALASGAAGAAGMVLAGPGAQSVWVQAALLLAAFVVAVGPWRLYWRRDSAFLARLPLSGRTIYAFSLWTAARAAATVGGALLLALVPLGLDALRYGAFGGLALAAAALLAPAATAAAGAIVVSQKAQSLVREISGGYTAPGVVWLSVLPAAGAFGVGAAAWGARGWLAGGPPPLPLLAGVAAAAALSAVALALADRFLATAVREVAAFDAVRLAHVDLVRARGAERLWGRVLRAGPVYEKDVALMRRRYPALYVAAGLVMVAMWAASASDEAALIGIVLLGALVRLHAYFLVNPPTEMPRLLRTLPVAGAGRAKRLHLLWRGLVTIVLGAAPAVVRTESSLVAALAVVTILVASWQSDDLVQLDGQPPPRVA